MKKILTSRKSAPISAPVSTLNLLAIMKCHNDPVYFIENFVMIQHPIRGLTSLKLFEYQKEYVRAMHKNSVIAKMGRQQGKTTVTLAFMLWAALFNRDSTTLFVTLTAAYDALNRLKLMIEHLPAWLGPTVRSSNKHMIELINGSRIVVTNAAQTCVRGMSFSTVVLDEFAYYKEPSIINETMPCLQASTGKLIITSTVHRKDDAFQKLYSTAERGAAPLGLIPFMATWQDHPERDINWANQQRQYMSNEMFMREYMCSYG